MIDIIVACLHGTEEYLYICLTTLLKLASNKNNIHLIIGIDLNQKTNVPLRNVRLKELHHSIEIHPITTGWIRSSPSHAMSLQYLYQKAKNQYRFVIDSDLAFVLKDWDKYLLNQLLQNEVSLIGIPYGDNRHYNNFPCAMGMLFDSHKIQHFEIDFMPILSGIPENLCPVDIKVTKKNTHIYNRPIGSKVRLDTGIHICHKFHEYQLKSISLIASTKDNSYFLKQHPKFPGQEYHTHDHRPIILHHDNSSSNRNPIIYDNKVTKIWVNHIIQYVQQHYHIDLTELNNIFQENWLS